MVPMPVTMPAPGASSRYIPFAARALNSRKGVPESSKAAMRSLTNILPREVWRFRTSSPPPCRTMSCFCFSSATSSSMASRLACVSAFANIPPDVIDDVFGGHSGLEDLADSQRLEFGDVLVGNDPADEDEHVIEFLVLHQFHDPGAKRHMGSGENRKANHI